MSVVPESRAAFPPLVYWVVAALLIAVGMLGAWGVGLPLLTLGLIFILLGPIYRFPKVFWPLGLAGFFVCATWFANWAWFPG